MSEKKRKIFGVVAAEADNIEQRQILNGIIEQAQLYGIDVAVFSNIFNPNIPDAEVSCENRIYELTLSSEIDALILISESIFNEELRKKIQKYLVSKNVPIIIIGTEIPAFNTSNFRFINTSDENDILDITNHLIEAHGFTNIDMLTGNSFLEASHLRVDGYRKSLEAHGIPFDKDKVYFGDFWMTSGEALAKKYIEGALPMPQAVVCANDYMAYGMLDAFSEYGIRVPEEIAVIGYEYIRQRYLHSPILTTYQRNRKAIGMEAVKILYCKITDGIDAEFSPPKGRIICGESCPCGLDHQHFQQELKTARIKQSYDQLNLYSQMEHRLTECNTLDEFVKVCGKSHPLIRGVYNVYLCLFDNWYNADLDDKKDSMSCQSIMPQFSNDLKIRFHKLQLSAIFRLHDKAAAYYFNPLFFADRLFGYVVLQFDTPDTYDHIFRSWMKSVSNALEFLRMKNDIKYLSHCQSLSETRDSLTGLYHASGLDGEVEAALERAKPADKLIMLMVQPNLSEQDWNLEKNNTEYKVNTILELAEAAKRILQNKNEFIARLEDDTFLFVGIGSYPDDYDKLLLDKLSILMLHAPLYQEKCSLQSFLCESQMQPALEENYHPMFLFLRQQLCERSKKYIEKRLLPNYESFEELRNEMYCDPITIASAQKICQRFCLSSGYFRATYKEYFGISYHKDCICSKIALAKYLLLTTTMNIAVIAEQCGYEDDKYFMHQFRLWADCTPNQYRKFYRSGS